MKYVQGKFNHIILPWATTPFFSTDSDTGRIYNIDNEKLLLPSVTTFLSATKSKESKEILDNWKNNLDDPIKTMKIITDRGEAYHSMNEDFLNNKKVPVSSSEISNLFKQTYQFVKNIGDVYSVEGLLYSELLGLAGRVDCVAMYNGKLSIIDFKTSLKNKKEEWIEDYFIQTTAYACMFNDLAKTYGLKERVQQVVIIMANTTTFNPQIFIKNPRDYISKLRERLNQFKQL